MEIQTVTLGFEAAQVDRWAIFGFGLVTFANGENLQLTGTGRVLARASSESNEYLEVLLEQSR